MYKKCDQGCLQHDDTYDDDDVKTNKIFTYEFYCDL